MPTTVTKPWPRSALAATTLRVVTFTAIVWLWAQTRSAAQQGAERRSVRSDLDLPLVIADPPASTWKEVTFRSLSGEEIQKLTPYADLVAGEMRLYSADYIRSSGLARIALVHDLVVEGQVRAAVPDFRIGVLFLDPAVGNWNSVYQRHLIHHEFFHFVEGKLSNDAYYHDPNWIKLNDPSARYGNGGKFARGDNVYEMTHPARGFINVYAESAVEEDMAEAFAAMLVPEERKQLEMWAKDDQVLRAKMNYLDAFFKQHGGHAEAVGQETGKSTTRP